jgi:multimeric flavodoxin WrbA
VSILCISGSPRKHSNTDYLLHLLQDQIGGEFIKLADHDIQPCRSCWACRKTDGCVIDDDMTSILIPKLLATDAVVLGSPVYFNNVTAQMKAFIDRTWCLRGELKNKIGGAVVVGRRYGAESAITAIHAFFLKHEMVVAHRGISGIAFAPGEIAEDEESIQAVVRLAARIAELRAFFQ